jgi:hypothetical protein
MQLQRAARVEQDSSQRLEVDERLQHVDQHRVGPEHFEEHGAAAPARHVEPAPLVRGGPRGEDRAAADDPKHVEAAQRVERAKAPGLRT